MRFKFGKYIITIVVSIFISFSINASHIMGGYFKIIMSEYNATSNFLQGSKYNIELTLYRDNANGLVTLPSCVTIGIYQVGTNILQETMNLCLDNCFSTNTGQVNNILLGDPCYSPNPLDLNVEEGKYTCFTTVFLPNYSSGYYVQYQTCCRSGLVTNLSDSNNKGISIFAMIPDPSIGINSSPYFLDYPNDAYLCVNNTKSFSWQVIDPDGDSLVYSLVPPLDEAPNPISSTDTGPGSGTYPFYSPLSYSNGYSHQNIVGNNGTGTPSMSIDSFTGIITARPSIIGYFSFSIRVEEYRGGIKIGEIRGDLLYKSEPCIVSEPPRLELNSSIGNFDVDIETQPCQHTFNMYDSFGDGWNGASVDILVNGNYEVVNATIASSNWGTGYDSSVHFMASLGDTIELVGWIPGSYPMEISWECRDGLGKVINQGYYPLQTTFPITVGKAKCEIDQENFVLNTFLEDSLCVDIEVTVGDPSDSVFTKLTSQNINLPTAYIQPTSFIPPGIFTIDMQDSYGDGWNGAQIDVTVNGTVVANWGLASGSTGSDSIFTVSGDIVDFTFISGAWDSEITFQITGPTGNSLGSFGPSPVTGLFLTHTYAPNPTLEYYNWNNTGFPIQMNPFVFKNGYIGSNESLYLRYCWDEPCSVSDTTLNILVDSYSIDCSGFIFTSNEIVFNCFPFTDVPTEQNETIVIYPNPTYDEIFINIDNFRANYTIEIFDMMGNKLKTTKNSKISFRDYSSGVYLLKLFDGEKIQNKKIIKK